MGGNDALNQKKAALRGVAKTFLEECKAATAKSESDLRRILHAGSMWAFEGGTVELTPGLRSSLDNLASAAVKVLGSKAGHEKGIIEIAVQQGKQFAMKEGGLDKATNELVDLIFAEANANFELLLPNYLMTFQEDVRSLTVGRVRAARTADLALELAARSPKVGFRIVQGAEFSYSFHPEPIVEMFPTCWLISVNAMRQNVDEEAKWLIDVALSLLRILCFLQGAAAIQYPRAGEIEPHQNPDQFITSELQLVATNRGAEGPAFLRCMQ